jgi:hypothetical protein
VNHVGIEVAQRRLHATARQPDDERPIEGQRDARHVKYGKSGVVVGSGGGRHHDRGVTLDGEMVENATDGVRHPVHLGQKRLGHKSDLHIAERDGDLRRAGRLPAPNLGTSRKRAVSPRWAGPDGGTHAEDGSRADDAFLVEFGSSPA